jgi:hypothetical protein
MEEGTRNPWREIESMAQAAGISYEYDELVSHDGPRKYLRLDLRAGRSDTRPLRVYQDDIDTVAATSFSSCVFLGDLAAYLDTEKGVIESLIRPAGRFPPRGSSLHDLINRFGNAALLSETEPVSDMDVAEGSGSLFGEGDSVPTALKLSDGDTAVEFSPCSPILSLTESRLPSEQRRLVSMKIRRSEAGTHDEALTFLRTFASALFFELDVNYGVLLTLPESRSAMRRYAQARSRVGDGTATKPPTVPRQAYNEEAVSLYTYGRSAQGMPLLEFLAYYQVIEYFFPTYARAEMVQRFRRELIDPRFDPASDTDVSRLVQILGGAGRGYMSESDQLKATLWHCVDEHALREFVEHDPAMEHFLTGKQEIKGVRSLDLKNRNQAITDQAAERVYQLRCRIVHSKEDGGPAKTAMLLPFGPESRKLYHDLALARFLAQKVMVMAAKPAPWRH